MATRCGEEKRKGTNMYWTPGSGLLRRALGTFSCVTPTRASVPSHSARNSHGSTRPPGTAHPLAASFHYYSQARKNYLVQVSFWLYWSPSPHHKMSLELEPLLNLPTTDPKHLPFSSAALFCAYHSSQAKITLQMNSIMHPAYSPC